MLSAAGEVGPCVLHGHSGIHHRRGGLARALLGPLDGPNGTCTPGPRGSFPREAARPAGHVPGRVDFLEDGGQTRVDPEEVDDPIGALLSALLHDLRATSAPSPATREDLAPDFPVPGAVGDGSMDYQIQDGGERPQRPAAQGSRSRKDAMGGSHHAPTAVVLGLLGRRGHVQPLLGLGAHLHRDDGYATSLDEGRDRLIQ
eukprot:5231061-Pyramimonas_sp.AAC.1